MLSKNLAAQPNNRSSHETPTPNLGGIAFYVILMISFYFISPYDPNNIVISLIPGLTILFIVGLKDDLLVLGPLTKLLAQLLAVVLFVIHYGRKISTLNGFMGIEDLNPFIGGAIAVFIIVAIINAVNLIDGIDGLAATVSIIMFTAFGYVFYTIESYFLFLTSVVMIGTLLAYLRFNLSPTKKIFMGDTGSMILGFMLAFALVLMVPAFAADQNIVEIASGNEDFSILVAALQEAELVGALEGEGPFTVFAPTNAAFEKLLGELDITADDLLGHPQLKEVLLYHVLSGKVMSTELTDGFEADTLNEQSVKFDLSDGVKVNESNVVTADLEATNGVIHVIDTVLVPSDFVLDADAESDDMPETVVDIALSNDDFSILVAALQKADLVGALQAEGPFTVFAPTNAAFEQLLKDLDISSSDLLNQPDLDKVLLYHVVSGKVMSTDLTNDLEAATLNGEKVKFDLSSGVMVSGSKVVTADLEAGNGVVHVIDKVMVPSNFTLQEVEEDTTIPETGVNDLMPIIGMSFIILAGAFLIKRKIYG